MERPTQRNKHGPGTLGRLGHVARASLRSMPEDVPALGSEAVARLRVGDLAAEVRPAEKKGGGEGARAGQRRGYLCLERPRTGHGRPPCGPPRATLPLRSGRREQLSSGRAKLEGTCDDPPAGHPPRGHSPPSRRQKDRGRARCADTSAREGAGLTRKPQPISGPFGGGRTGRRKPPILRKTVGGAGGQSIARTSRVGQAWLP